MENLQCLICQEIIPIERTELVKYWHSFYLINGAGPDSQMPGFEYGLWHVNK